jgi:hypothetical protein
MEAALRKTNNLLAPTLTFFQRVHIPSSPSSSLRLFDHKYSIRLAFLLLEQHFSYFLPKNVFAAEKYFVFSQILRYFIERRADLFGQQIPRSWQILSISLWELSSFRR